MPRISITLNNKRIEAETGSTILEVAHKNGVEIPTLCHDPRLRPSAACRLCIVEVEGARSPMPACVTQATDGIVVRTRTEDVDSLRRMALELLLSDHYGDCIAPCSLACPAGIDIQGYVGHIANGQYREALKLIKERNPMPLTVGRVCPRFCEVKCRRNLLDEPIAINMLKRFVADYDLDNGGPYVPEPKPDTGHKVAIVGGGPAGLSAAYYLALEGHGVTIYEASPKLGGMLRYGIPEYRLPKTILDEEIASITGLCHEVRGNMALGRDFSLESLREDGYEAIFVAIGAQASQSMRVPGEELRGVLSGIEFLRNTALGERVELGQKVAVIGGGNTAMDAARTALRLGAGEVTILYRRSRDEMPANDEEVEQAEQEGIRFQFLAAPVKVIAQNGRADSLEFIKMALGEPDSSGRRRPEPVAGSEFILQVNTVIAAIGQTIDASGVHHNGLIEFDRRGYIGVNSETMATTQSAVFAGGDCTSGPATVIEAIAAGRRAAVSINQYLNGEPVMPPPKMYNCTKGELEELDVEDYALVERKPRAEMPALEPTVRKQDFAEIELGLTPEMAATEAGRCLACGCQDVFECQLRKLATEYGVNDNHYSGRKHHLPIKENEHRDILRDPNKCILCGRCVRICDEVEGVGALGFTHRGFDTVVEPSLGMPLGETLCESCGQCISTCPTGALTPKVPLPKPGPWRPEVVSTTCGYCGIGCNLELAVTGDKITRVSSPLSAVVNGGNLCKKGSFYPYSVHKSNRIKTPLVKQGGQLVETGWPEALSLAGEGLKQIRDSHGGDSLAVLVSPQLTNEELYIAQKLARVALNTNNIGCLTSPGAGGSLMKSLGREASTVSYHDILASDLIMAFNCDLAEDYPVIALKVREAVSRGSRLISLNPRATRLDSLARVTLKTNRRISLDLLKTMLGYILAYNLDDHDFIDSRTKGFRAFSKEIKGHPLEDIADSYWVKPSKIIEAIHLYIRARRPVIIVNMDTITPAELTLISDLSLITGNVGRDGAGIIALRAGANAQGMIDMGAKAARLPIIEGIERGEVQCVLVLGSDATGVIGNAIFEVPIFSVLVGTVLPEKPPYPNLVLPGATFIESDGTYTNCERRVQQLRCAVPPPAGKQNWEIISALSASVGCPMQYSSASDISKEIAAFVPLYKGVMPDGQWQFLSDGRFEFDDGLARIRLPDLRDAETLEALIGFL